MIGLAQAAERAEPECVEVGTMIRMGWSATVAGTTWPAARQGLQMAEPATSDGGWRAADLRTFSDEAPQILVLTLYHLLLLGCCVHRLPSERAQIRSILAKPGG